MRRAALTLLTLTSLLAHSFALAQEGRDLTRREAAAVFERVFHGRTQSALAYLDSLSGECEGYPLYHIMRGRCLQESIPMDDSNTNNAKQAAVPALTEFDQAIAACTARIDSGGAHSTHYLYRGWAWMAKSYIRSMSRSFWTAGREAGRGKKDLQVYLGAYPDDTTANGIMGAFLYFADTIPKAFKFFSKLLRLPSGDRVEGLERLQYAALYGGPLDTDYKFVLYNVYFYFEGRYEEGLARMQEMVERYPEYSRSSIPLSAARPFVPRLATALDAQIESTLERMAGLPAEGVDYNGLALVKAFRAYGDRYCNPEASAARFQAIIDEEPQHPDWMRGFARYELGSLYAATGRRSQARELFESVVTEDAYRYHRDHAGRMLTDLDQFADSLQSAERPDDDWIKAVYQAGADSLAVLAARFETFAPASLPASFYLAECRLLAGDHDGALDVYRGILDTDAPAWEETYQLLAAQRVAEIYAAREKYKTAAEYLERAKDFYHKEYLVDWILSGRKRYFERLADGRESVTPNLLSVNP
jgi:tetratricopeptide (TPR) repeat protein